MKEFTREELQEQLSKFFQDFNSYKDGVKIQILDKKEEYSIGDEIDVKCDIYGDINDEFDFFIKETRRGRVIVKRRD